MPDFTLGRRSMVYDRGRYKQIENRGSQSDNKQDVYRRGVSRLLPKTTFDSRQTPGIPESRTRPILTRRQQAEKQLRDRQMFEEERRRRQAAERSGAEPLANIRKRVSPISSRLQRRVA